MQVPSWNPWAFPRHLGKHVVGRFFGDIPGPVEVEGSFFFFFFWGGGGRFLVMALMATRFSGGNAPVEVGW